MAVKISRKCTKCGKMYVSEHPVCPFCNPKTAIALSGLKLLGKMFGSK